jgi:hypothetical protein
MTQPLQATEPAFAPQPTSNQPGELRGSVRSEIVDTKSTLESLETPKDKLDEPPVDTKTVRQYFQEFGEAFIKFFKDLYGSISHCIYELFLKPDGLETLPLNSDLSIMGDLLTMLIDPTATKEEVLAAIGKISEEKLKGDRGLYSTVFHSLNPQGPVSDSYGEEEVNKDPKNEQLVKIMQGFIMREEKVIPLQDFVRLWDNSKISDEEILQRFNQLPMVKGTNLKEVVESCLVNISECEAGDTPYAKNLITHNVRHPSVREAVLAAVDML